MTRKEAREQIKAGAYSDLTKDIFALVVGPDGEATIRYFDKKSRLRAADPTLFDGDIFAVPVPADQQQLIRLPKDEPIFALFGNTFPVKSVISAAGLKFHRAIVPSEDFSPDTVREGWIGTYSQVASLVGKVNFTTLI